MANIQKSKLTVEAVSRPRAGYNGGPMNIGIKSSNGNWARCEVKELWPLFVKGATLEVMVEVNGEYLNIVDVVNGDKELESKGTFDEPEKPAPKVQQTHLERIEKQVNAIAKMVEEINLHLQKMDFPPID